VKHLIVNADDLGYSPGVNSGIFECHTRGIVTSASLMVTGRAAAEAATISREHPKLSVGLHWDVWGEDERSFDVSDLGGVHDEFHRQLERFERLLGRMPTHVDSHRHVHREDQLMSLFQQMVEPLGVPLRGDGRVNIVGGFYAQWVWQVTNLDYVSVPFLQRLLSEEVPEGWTELSCHPGYLCADDPAVYSSERAAEVKTLTDPRALRSIDELGIQLTSYHDYERAV
jgi:chitin disaccharide deacetylase